jgi:hypothetical protein
MQAWKLKEGADKLKFVLEMVKLGKDVDILTIEPALNPYILLDITLEERDKSNFLTFNIFL